MVTARKNENGTTMNSKALCLNKKPSSLLRFLIRSLGSLLFILILLGGYAGILQLTGNFHTVLAGELYRASQPSSNQIASYKKDYGIRTIVNLRGDNTGSPWYDEEVEAAKKLGITHINFRMSARRELTQERSEELVSILRDAPKPILVHCNGGADRSGLASALFLAAVANKGEEAAEDQLSFHYGHVSIPYLSSSFAMDRTFENLETWLGFEGS